MNNRRLNISPAFWGDLREQVGWYDDRQEGLGWQLHLEVEQYLEKLLEQPTLYSVVRRTIYRVRLPRFQHYIVYDVADDFVHVIGLVHASRDFRRWLKRRLSDS